MNIAYFVRSYPSVSQTFIVREIHQLEKLGNKITIFALEKGNINIIHPEILEVDAETVYFRFPLLRLAKLLEVLWVNLVVAIGNLGGYLKVIKYVVNKPFENTKVRWGTFLRLGYFSYLIKNLSVDRIHAHFATSWAENAMLISWIVGIPFSLTTHARDIFVGDSPDVRALVLPAADVLITISEYNRQFLLNTFSDILTPQKIFVVHCGIDLQYFPFSSHIKTSKKYFSIVTVARLVEKKGHTTIIEALAMLKEQGITVNWVVIGEGPLRFDLEKLVIANNLKDDVKFLGAAGHDEIQKVMQKANVMVLPCTRGVDGDQDGIPVALMEAMAMGLPVISTHISGIPELIDSEKNGILIPPDNSSALADTLRRFLTGQINTRRLTAMARKKIETDFNIEIEARRLLEIFQGRSQF